VPPGPIQTSCVFLDLFHVPLLAGVSALLVFLPNERTRCVQTFRARFVGSFRRHAHERLHFRGGKRCAHAASSGCTLPQFSRPGRRCPARLRWSAACRADACARAAESPAGADFIQRAKERFDLSGNVKVRRIPIEGFPATEPGGRWDSSCLWVNACRLTPGENLYTLNLPLRHGQVTGS